VSIIFTNGVFDILHKGHISLLEYCRILCNSLEDKVIVGINSDESASRIKREPFNNQYDRKYLLEALKYVDEVIIFNEDTPYDLINRIKPDILVKGGDYTIETIVGSDIVNKTIVFPTKIGYSTTNILRKKILNKNLNQGYSNVVQNINSW
jgi:D-beta-D-heptose 7-phosphate kinase/D-beta-D-heptose 1-phosphate adenosyltransferase